MPLPLLYDDESSYFHPLAYSSNPSTNSKIEKRAQLINLNHSKTATNSERHGTNLVPFPFWKNPFFLYFFSTAVSWWAGPVRFSISPMELEYHHHHPICAFFPPFSPLVELLMRKILMALISLPFPATRTGGLQLSTEGHPPVWGEFILLLPIQAATFGELNLGSHGSSGTLTASQGTEGCGHIFALPIPGGRHRRKPENAL